MFIASAISKTAKLRRSGMWLLWKRLTPHLLLLRSFCDCDPGCYKHDAPTGAIGFRNVFHTTSEA